MKLQQLIKTKKFKFGSILASVFAVFALGSFAFFSFLNSSSSGAGLSAKLADARSRIQEEPKTEECPLNGALFSKTEKGIWDKRRPMGVMIENHLDARPLSGLSKADVVYEAVAEGGITRFLSIFYCGAASSDVAVGPVRSARVYFMDWISEYGKDPLYVHFGGANNICTNEEDPECLEDGTKIEGKVDPRVMAIEKLVRMGWRHSKGNALDGGTNAGPPYIVRDLLRTGKTVAHEHTAIGSSDKLFDLGIANGFDGKGWDKNFVSWKFQDGQALSTPKASEIEFEFWSNKADYDVAWQFDKATNSYLRSNGGKPHTDWEFDNVQLSAKNVVIMFVPEEGPVDEEYHMYYETIGEGEAIIFQNGDIIEGKWEKSSQFDRTIFTDGSGEEIKFVRGVIWIEAVPKGNDIVYN